MLDQVLVRCSFGAQTLSLSQVSLQHVPKAVRSLAVSFLSRAALFVFVRSLSLTTFLLRGFSGKSYTKARVAWEMQRPSHDLVCSCVHRGFSRFL